MRRRGWLAVGLVVLASSTFAAPAAMSPEDTIRRYLQDTKEGNFDDAYDLVSKAMRRGEDKEGWVKGQKAGMGFAGGKEVGVHLPPGEIGGGTPPLPHDLPLPG